MASLASATSPAPLSHSVCRARRTDCRAARTAARVGSCKQLSGSRAVQVVFELGFDEDTASADRRTALSALGAGLALFAFVYAYFVPYPACTSVLVACIAGYVVILLVVCALDLRRMRHLLLEAHRRNPIGARADDQLLVEVRAAPYDELYEVTLRLLPAGRTADAVTGTLPLCLSDFFHEDGYLNETRLLERLRQSAPLRHARQRPRK